MEPKDYLLRAWDYPRGQWDPAAILFGIDPGDLDPIVPRPEDFHREDWRAITDAEGDLICLVPKRGPWDQDDWPERLAEFLNAATDKADEGER